VERFEGRVLAIDAVVAATWGKVVARADVAGMPISAMDGFLAATALVHGMSMVTRHESDFEVAGIRTFNPWRN
jgi:toxin FitB